jgi:hypothetical protein
MQVAAATAVVVVLAGVAVFQLALIAGAPLGHFAWGGQHRVLPNGLRIGSAISIAIYALIAAAILDRAGLLAILPAGVDTVVAWVIAGYFGFGIVLNAISRSVPERLTMTPIVLFLTALCVIVASGWGS